VDFNGIDDIKGFFELVEEDDDDMEH